MKNKRRQRGGDETIGVGFVLTVIAVAAAFRTGGFLRYPFADGDLFWQRRLGEFVLTQHALPHALGTDVFSAVGSPWVPQEWFFSALVAIAFDHGALWALTLGSGLFACIALALAAWRALRAGAPAWGVAAAALVAAICISPTFALRAQVWVWPLYTLALLVLDADGPALWWLVPITVVWANLHASVMIVVPIVWLNAAVRAWTSRGHALPGLRTRLALCVAVPLATLATPLGIHLPLYAISLLHSPLRAYIREWLPLTSGLSSDYLLFGFLPLVALLVVALIRRTWEKRPFDVVLSLVLAALSFFAARNVALFAFAAVVPASLALRSRTAPASTGSRWRLTGTAAAALFAVLVAGWFGFLAGPPGVRWPAPFGAVQQLAALPGEHQLLCAEYSWCSIALGDPNIRIFLDGRADPYPASVWAADDAITHARPGWQRLLASYGVNAVIAWRGGFFESRMQTLARWKEITATNDPCCVLFVRQEVR